MVVVQALRRRCHFRHATPGPELRSRVVRRRALCPLDGVGLVRILVTNDDGVEAPGIAALAAAAARTRHEVLVVAPLEDWSGASSAVGAFYRRDGVDYRTFTIEGLEDVPTYGIDGTPALGVILSCVGGFGPRPDMVLSGINHGVNVGRSALHSGTIGAVLTAAQFGVRGLATSIRFGPDPVPWETAADLAASLIPLLLTAPPGTALNLNVPDVRAEHLSGVRAACLGRGGTIRSVTHDIPDDDQRSRGTGFASILRRSGNTRGLASGSRWNDAPRPGDTRICGAGSPGRSRSHRRGRSPDRS